jgi:hypothetical protein
MLSEHGAALTFLLRSSEEVFPRFEKWSPTAGSTTKMAILDKLRCPEKFLAIQAAIRYNLSFCRTPKILADGKSDSSGSEIVPNCKGSASWGALKASKIRN